MKSSLTVFVCGTYADLSAERGAVLDAIQRLQLEHHSMEFFGARPERPIETCLAEVRRSDVLVVIVGQRYGTLVPGLQISFSEAEYEEARRLNKPCLVYIRDNRGGQPALSEQEAQEDPLLERWKATLRVRHTIFTFRDANSLAVQVAVDVGREISRLETLGRSREPSSSVVPLHATQRPSRITVRSSQKFGDQGRQLLHGLKTDAKGNITIVGVTFGEASTSGDRG